MMEITTVNSAPKLKVLEQLGGIEECVQDGGGRG